MPLSQNGRIVALRQEVIGPTVAGSGSTLEQQTGACDVARFQQAFGALDELSNALCLGGVACLRLSGRNRRLLFAYAAGCGGDSSIVLPRKVPRKVGMRTFSPPPSGADPNSCGPATAPVYSAPASICSSLAALTRNAAS